MLEMIQDMETQDPDDFLTLLFLLGRSDVHLKAVTITPGSAHQVGLVRRALEWFDRDIPVGAGNLNHEKTCVSSWHYAVYGKIPPSNEAQPAAEVILDHCGPDTILLTGAPLKNLGAAMNLDEAEGSNRLQFGQWVAQGGFAGEGVVPFERQLPKFRGRTTCPTFNLNGDPKSALKALSHCGFALRRFVSKNVCHGVVYDQSLHEVFAEKKEGSLSLQLIWKGMAHYLKKNPDGKKLHDPLAACCAIEPLIGTWAEVEIYHEQGEWGSRLSPDSGTWIITDYDHERFVEVLTETL